MLPQMATPKKKEKFSKRAYALTALLRQLALDWFAFDQPGHCVAAEKRSSLSAACPLAGSLATSQASGSSSTGGGPPPQWAGMTVALGHAGRTSVASRPHPTPALRCEGK